MLIKVCGMTDELNLRKISLAEIDMVGLNFYPKSKRFLANEVDIANIPKEVAIVGVFVNESLDKIFELVKKYNLDFVQLHGDETNEFCKKLRTEVKVIKAIPIKSKNDFKSAHIYKDVDYILFDTKTKMIGGSGRKFDWSILQNYEGTIPYLLAGGIKSDDVEAIKEIQDELFAGVDINSQFESEPGIKRIPAVHKFAYALKNKSY